MKRCRQSAGAGNFVTGTNRPPDTSATLLGRICAKKTLSAETSLFMVLVVGALLPGLARAQSTNNTKVGPHALLGNTGTSDTAVGSAALSPNGVCLNSANPFPCCTGAHKGNCGDVSGCTGSHVPKSCCTGPGTGSCGNSGFDNDAVGWGALSANTSGIENEAMGVSALGANTTGSENTAVGSAALANCTTGNQNIALGSHAGDNITTGSNNIDIGHAGVPGDTATIRIGNPPTHTATFIAGISGAAVSGAPVVVAANGQLGVIPSSTRYKTDIRDMGDSSRVLMHLRPVRFHYKKDIDPTGLEQYGLVAEEVAKVNPDLVVTDADGEPQTVRYHFVNAMLLNEVQKQARQIAAQRQQLTQQAREMAQLKEQTRQIGTLTARLTQLEDAVSAQGQAPAVKASYSQHGF